MEGGENMSDAKKKMLVCIISIVLLIVCFALSTFALAFARISVNGHVFSTGTVTLDFNGGQKVIEDKGSDLFRPGKTVTKEFYLQNTGTDALYYKFWFDNVEGKIAKYIDVTIRYDGRDVLKGKLTELSKMHSESIDTPLQPGEKRVFEISFHMSLEVKDRMQGKYVDFEFCAGATQAKNNPDRLF